VIPIPQSVTVITQPASEPVTVAEAKAHCRVEISDDDSYIGALITAARETAEALMQRRIMTTVCEVRFGEWPETELWIPGPPLQSVTFVKYIDTNGTEQTWASTDYLVDPYAAPGRLKRKEAATYPQIQLEQLAPITVRYSAGYADAASVPKGIKQAILLLVGLWYNAREDASTAKLNEMPMGAKRLLGQYSVPWGYTHA
jgi:uncharacterized phiE125 gp8 family phage protein